MMKNLACLLVSLLLASSADAFTAPVQHCTTSTSTSSTSTTSSTQIYSSAAASETVVAEGLLKTVTQPGRGGPVKLGDIATVKYSCYLPDAPDQRPFSKSSLQKIVVGDGTMIAGWDKALKSMRIGERAVVRIVDPALGYGPAGVPPLVPSNAALEIDLEVLDSAPPLANIDFDNLAMADNTPRTAEQISAAYEVRRAKAALTPEKEGLEGWIEKAKNFYFFGLFEGETGQKAPWFLRPSITFPIAFLIVGAAFYVSFATGAITERGAQVQDELDEIILTSTAAAAADPSGFLLAMTTMLSSNGIEI